jgi:hypothetical protein
MNFQVSKKMRSLIGSLAAAVILLVVIFWGAGSGQKQAEAQTVISAAKSTVSALQFFYQDQNRYPSATEFLDQNVMLNYLSSFPLPQLVSNACSQTFVYKKITENSFQLNFCLPVAEQGYQQGWNVINGSPSGN